MKKVLFIFLISWTWIIVGGCDTEEEGLIVYPGPYLGILHTGEEDPTPLGGDNDGDWNDLPHKGFYAEAAYPNPTDDKCNIRFRNNFKREVVVYLHHPIAKQTEIIYDNIAFAGVYEINVSLKSLKFAKGFIRCYFMVEGSITYGDIFYK